MKPRSTAVVIQRWMTQLGSLLPLVFVVACGGGGGGTPPPNDDSNIGGNKLGDNVVELKNSVEAFQSADGTITLTGDVPQVTNGQIVVAPTLQGMREGLALKVTEVQQGRGELKLKGSPASITEVWKELHASTLAQVMPPDGARGRSPDTFSIPIQMVVSDNQNRSLTFSGVATFKLWIDAHVDIAFPYDLRYAKSIARLDASIQGKLTAEGTRSFTLSKFKLWESPFLAPVYLGPVAFFPKITLYAKFNGSLDVGAGVDVIGSLNAAVGPVYEKGRGWYALTEATPSLSFPKMPETWVTAKGELVLLSAELELKAYNAAGPFVNVDLPEFQYDLRSSSNPAKVVFNLDAEFQGRTGFRADLFGLKYEWTSDDFSFAKFAIIDDWTWRPNGDTQVEIK